MKVVSFVTLIVALVLFAPVCAQAKGVTMPREGERLSAAEIVATLSNSDMYGTFANGGSDWAERTTADGRVLNLKQEFALVGSWAVANGEACYIYHGKPSRLICYAMHQSNGKLLFYNPINGRLVSKTNRIVRQVGIRKSSGPSALPVLGEREGQSAPQSDN
jgi:hypothetical protein